MLDAQTPLVGNGTPEETSSIDGQTELFPEFEELRQQISRRIRDNQRFLERVFDEDFAEDEAGDESEEEQESLEEL